MAAVHSWPSRWSRRAHTPRTLDTVPNTPWRWIGLDVQVLSISHRMQHRELHNATIFNAPSIQDFDAVLVDTHAMFESIREATEKAGEFQTYNDLPVVNGSSVDGFTGIADVLQRRREEFRAALERGVPIVVIPAPVEQLTNVAGFHGLDRYWFLPAPEGTVWDASTIVGGEGANVSINDHQHPFVAIIEAAGGELRYRAHLNERASGFPRDARIFARSAGGAAVGVEVPVLNGRVIFVPGPREAGARWLAQREGEAVVEAFRDMLDREEEMVPSWVPKVSVPSLDERERALKGAEEALETARAALDAARDARDAVAVLRDILWTRGARALGRGVTACALALGFEVTETDDGLVLSADGGEIFVEAAASRDPIEMGPHYALRARIDAAIEERAAAPRGMVAITGHRLLDPSLRRQEYKDSLRVAAESVGFALVHTHDLFRAAIAALEGADPTTIGAVRERLATTNGVVDLDDLIGPAEGKQPADDASDEARPAEAAAGDAASA
jgi:hypothetical protein